MSSQTAPSNREPARTVHVSILQIFLEFLFIGATSFGGGVVAYLRANLVAKRAWIDDKELIELLGISQSLPGLNATNMAVLIGDRLRRLPGAIAAIVGMCIPGGIFMYIAASVYAAEVDRPVAEAALKGVAAAAVGLILATTTQLGRKALSHRYDLIFVALAVVGILLGQSVLTVLLVVGAIAIAWYRPGGRAIKSAPEQEPEEAAE